MDYGTIPNLLDDETGSMLSASAGASVRIPFVASSAGSGSEATTSKARPQATPLPIGGPPDKVPRPSRSATAISKVAGDADWFCVTFDDKTSAMFEHYDGLGSGRYAVSEQNVNRPATPPIPSRSASAGAEEFDIAAGDADDEQSDEDDSDVEMAPIGPLPDDHPILEVKSKMPLYCTSCHQDVLVIRFNICPKCTCTDSTLPMDHWITKSCRDSPIVND